MVGGCLQRGNGNISGWWSWAGACGRSPPRPSSKADPSPQCHGGQWVEKMSFTSQSRLLPPGGC